jgi:hypothetical protein
LQHLNLDPYSESCIIMVRMRLIASLKEALSLASTSAALPEEEVLARLESQVKLIVEHNFPQNVEMFVSQNLQKIKEKPPFWFPLEPVQCIICVEQVSDCRLLPGNSEVFCTCKEMPVCVECMLRHYWQNSECNRKSFAVCPQCRGEFRLSNLVHVQYESWNAPSAPLALSAPSAPSEPSLSEEQEPPPKDSTLKRRKQQKTRRSLKQETPSKLKDCRRSSVHGSPPQPRRFKHRGHLITKVGPWCR